MSSHDSESTDSASFAAVVVAGGSGSRLGGDVPKQYRQLGGKPVLRHSLEAFAAHPACGKIVLVAADEARALEASQGIKRVSVVSGGASRRESVANGLAAMGGVPYPIVLIHDAARPGLDQAALDRLLAALDSHDGAIPVLAVSDSVARIDGGLVAQSVERDGLVRVQTPQAFRTDAILRAHAEWPADREATDDARMLMASGGSVAAVPGDERLMKITYVEDLARFEAMEARTMAAMRIGKGYDVHRLEAGETLWLCGVEIEHSHGLAGHSDADVAIHALCDAIFGALGDGDIGAHFPPSDEKWRGVSSDNFLAHAMKRAREAGYELVNCDLTIICEAPRIGPHRDAMRARLAEIMGVDPAAVGVKATTTEKLGFTGRGEGIAAEAVVLLQRE